MHKAWLFSAALAAAGSAGTPALAFHACGPWGAGEATRCLGYNGLSRDQPSGLSSRYYRIDVTAKATVTGPYSFSVDVWRSTCGFGGVLAKDGIRGGSNTTNLRPPFFLSERADHLQCVEFFINKCTLASHAAVPCGDVVDATIKEGQ